MNTYLRILACLIFVSCVHFCRASCAIQKVFHNKTYTTDKGPYVEIASVVFYVDAYPQVEQVSLVPNAHHETRTFLLKDVQELSSECRAAIHELNKSAGNLYAIKASSVSKPTKGIRIEITYDPQKIEVVQKNYQAITTQKSVVFHFYNKPFLKQLARNPKKIIEVASLDQPKKVVIDCGHGGKDTGALGCNQVCEKDVSRQVGLTVAQLLKKNGFTVILSREGDATVALDERTSCANKERADIFVSIHANASTRNDVCGIETHCMKPELFKQGMCTLSPDAITVCESLFHERCDTANQLAHSVHNNLLTCLTKNKYQVVDRHVRYAVPQVLLGSEMPGILLEIGFLSHPREAQLLADASYQKHIAQGIAQGISSFFKNSF